jgi:hypothetical protein
MSTTEKWFCIGCHFLLGFVEDKKIVRIKRKDLYIQITGGQVMVNCCRCGKPNFLADDKPDLINLKEKGGE